VRGVRGPPAPRALHSPHDEIAACALSPDFATDRTLFVGLPRFNLLLRSTDAGGSWTSVNTGLDTAYVVSLAVSPDYATDDTLWCVEIAGLFRSVDRGGHWERLDAPAGLRQVTWAEPSPDWARDHTLVVATQRDGVWLGRERGTDWTRVGPAAGGTGPADVAVGPVALARDEDGGLLLWGLQGGRLLRARVGRGERSWTEVGTPDALAGQAAATLVVDGEGPRPAALYAGTERGVLRSADAGGTWTREPPGDGPVDVLHLALARDARGGALLWASTAEHGVGRRDADGAWSFSREGFREPTHQTQRHWLGTRPSPDHARDRTLYALAYEGLYVSRDGGDTWRWLNLLHPELIRNVAFSPDFADDGGLWIPTYGAGMLASDDAGRSFRRVDTLDWWFPDGVAVSPDYARDGTVLIGTPNRLLVTRDGGISVGVALAAKGFARMLAFAPDWAASGQAYAYLATDTGLGTNRFVVTTDRGTTWRDTPLRTVFDVAFATDFAESGRLWAGTPDGLFRSDDRGARFERVGTLQAAGINSVALAPGATDAAGARGPDALAVVSRGSGLHLSRDGGATWTRPERGLDGVRAAFVELSPDFARDGLVYAGPLNAGVHVSRDGGRSFSRVPGGPALVQSMAISPTYERDRTLLVGAYDGPWLGRQDGTAWERLAIPLPEGDPVHSQEPGEVDTPAPRRDPPKEGTPRHEVPAPAGHESETDASAPGPGPGDADGSRSVRLVEIIGAAGAVVAALAALLAVRRRARG
jgi:hypothetical protein